MPSQPARWRLERGLPTEGRPKRALTPARGNDSHGVLSGRWGHSILLGVFQRRPTAGVDPQQSCAYLKAVAHPPDERHQGTIDVIQ